MSVGLQGPKSFDQIRQFDTWTECVRDLARARFPRRM